MADYSAIIAQIQKATSLSQISSLVSQFSANGIGSGGVLYSGNVGGTSAHAIALGLVNANAANGTTLNIIDNTARGLLLEDAGVQAAITTSAQNIAIAGGLSVPAAQAAAVNFIYGNTQIATGQAGSIASSLWGQASSDFVASLSGSITVIGSVQQANPLKTFATVELTAALSNPNLTYVGGVAISDLKQAGVNVFSEVFNGFQTGLLSGGVYTAADGTGVSLSQELVQALGFNAANVPTAAELAAEGLNKLATTTALTTATEYLGLAGAGALKLLGGVTGGVIVNLLASSSPANASEDKLLFQERDSSDLPVSPPPLGTVTQNANGTTSVSLPFNLLDASADNLGVVIGSGASANTVALSDVNTLDNVNYSVVASYQPSSGAISSAALSGVGIQLSLSLVSLYVQSGSQAILQTSYDPMINCTGATLSVVGTGDIFQAYSGSLTLNGTNEQGTVNGTTLTLLSGSQANLQAAYDPLISCTGATLSATGNGNTFQTYGGSLTINGTGNYGTVNGNVLTLANASQANLFTSYDTMINSTGATLSAYGNGNTFQSYSGTLTISGTGNYGTVNGNVLTLASGSQASLFANYDPMINSTGATLSAYGNGNIFQSYAGSLTISGTNEQGTINGNTLTLLSGSQASFSASYDPLINCNNATLTTTGDGDIFNALGCALTVTGKNEQGTINNSTLTLLNNSQGSVGGSFDTAILSSGVSLTLTGTNNQVGFNGVATGAAATLNDSNAGTSAVIQYVGSSGQFGTLSTTTIYSQLGGHGSLIGTGTILNDGTSQTVLENAQGQATSVVTHYADGTSSIVTLNPALQSSTTNDYSTNGQLVVSTQANIIRQGVTSVHTHDVIFYDVKGDHTWSSIDNFYSDGIPFNGTYGTGLQALGSVTTHNHDGSTLSIQEVNGSNYYTATFYAPHGGTAVESLRILNGVASGVGGNIYSKGDNATINGDLPAIAFLGGSQGPAAFNPTTLAVNTPDISSAYTDYYYSQPLTAIQNSLATALQNLQNNLDIEYILVTPHGSYETDVNGVPLSTEPLTVDPLSFFNFNVGDGVAGGSQITPAHWGY